MKRTTYLETLMHLCKGTLGAGIFSMGVAFKNAGMAVALISAPLIALIIIYCVHMLVEAIEIANNSRSEIKTTKDKTAKDKYAIDKAVLTEDDSSPLTYATVVRIILLSSNTPLSKLAKPLYGIVHTGICIMYMGFSSLYVVFVGRNMHEVLEIYDIHIEKEILMIIFTLPMWILSMIPNLKLLSPVSAFANLLLLLCFGISYYYIFEEVSLGKHVEINYVGDLEDIPLFFGVALFSFEMVALIFPLRHEMKKPEQLTSNFGVLNIGFVLVSFFIIFMGATSYLAYGNNLGDTVLANFPQDAALTQVVLILVSVQVVLTYPLQLYVPITICWGMISNKFGPFKRPTLLQSLFRTFLVLITVTVGESIPFIDLLISLIGSVCSTSLTLLIPPLLNILIHYPQLKTTKPKVLLLLKNGLIMIIAIIIFFSGLISTIRDIIKEFQK